MRKFLATSLFLVLTSCANPYQTARSTVMIGRGAIAMSQTGVDTYVLVETQKCQDQCKTDPACVDKCLAPVKQKVAVYQQAKLTATAGCDEADALINVSEKLKKGETVDWLVPLKTTACVLARGLEFLPTEIKQKIQGLIDMMGSFGCPVK